MKFLKKILISMTIVLVLFSAIRNNTTVVKNNEVHADAIAALPILAANPELIPIFALGFFVLVTCKLAADNFDNIIAVGNATAETIKAAGKSVSDFVNASGQIIMNEALKSIIKTTVDDIAKNKITTVSYNSEALTSEPVAGTSDDFLKGINATYKSDYSGSYTWRYAERINILGGTVVFDGKSGVYSGQSYYNYMGLETIKYISASSLSLSFSGKMPGIKYRREGTSSKNVIYITLLRMKGDNPKFYSDVFTVNLDNVTPYYLQELFSRGILLSVSYDDEKNVVGFDISILSKFPHSMNYSAVSKVEVSRALLNYDGEEKFSFKKSDFSKPQLNRFPFEALATKVRSVKSTASLFTGAIDLKSVEKSLDIAFPGTNDTLIPLDNVLNNPNSDVKDLKGLDAVLKNPNKFLDDDKRNKLDDVYKNAGTLDLKGIDNVSDKEKFNIKDYALDKTKVSDKDTPTDKPLEGEHKKEGTFSDIPILGLLGRLWDWLKEFAQELIKAIADGVKSIVDAIGKLFDLINKILDFLVVDVLVGDLDSFKDNFNNMQKTLHNKFPDITPLNLSFTDKDGFDDFTADLPLVGHQVIIKGSFMNQFARPARAFFSGLFYFLTGLFFFRKFHKVSEG